MCESIEVFGDLEVLLAALGDIGASHVRIDTVNRGYRVSISDDLLGKLKQHYAKRMVLQVVSRTPGHSVKRITEKDGKIRIRIAVK